MIRQRIRAKLEPTLAFKVAQRVYHRVWRNMAESGSGAPGLDYLHDIVYAWLFAGRDQRYHIVEALRFDAYGQRLFRRAGGVVAAFRLFYDSLPPEARAAWTTPEVKCKVYDNPCAYREPGATFREKIVTPESVATLDEAAESLATIMRVNGVHL